ncbi:hypothetical protein TKK_0001629 [Trichogramma kaykai]
MAQVVAQLSYSNGRNSQQRGHSPGHRRDSSQHRGRSKSPGPPNICWYHRKHGKDAERCTLPCLFDPPLIGLRRDLPWDFVVADVPLAILGADFLAYFGLLLDCKNQCLVDPLTGISAKDNVVADALSRISPANDSNDSSSKPEEPAHSSDNETPSPPGEAQEPPEIATITMPNRLSPATIAAAQEDDEGLMDAQAQPSFNLQQIVLDEYEIWCYVAHGSVRPYLPTKLRRVAYEIKHLPAHPGVKATARAVAESFVWPGVIKMISEKPDHLSQN